MISKKSIYKIYLLWKKVFKVRSCRVLNEKLNTFTLVYIFLQHLIYAVLACCANITNDQISGVAIGPNDRP